MGSVWAPDTWATDAWAVDTWAESEEPVINEAQQSVISMAVGIGMSILLMLGGK